MMPRDPTLDGDDLVATMAELVARMPGDDELRAQATDIAERLSSFVDAARLSLVRYQLLFEEAPDPYVVTDREGTITEANASARMLLGADDGDLPGKTLASFVVDEDTAEVEFWLNRLRSGTPDARWDAMFEIGDLGPTPVEVRLADDLSGIGYRWVLREQRIRNAVERHLRDVAESEREMADELRAEAQVRTAFLIALSHDLRAPIGALVHQAQLLGNDGLDADVRRRSLETLQENAGVLGRMMDDLIDIERFAHGELQLDRRSTAFSTVLEAVNSEDVDLRWDGGEAWCSVDIDVMARAISSMVRAKRHRAETAMVKLTGRVTDGFIEIVVRAKTPKANPSEVAEAIRTVEKRLTEVLVEAHGGSVVAEAGAIVLRLPRLDTDGVTAARQADHG